MSKKAVALSANLVAVKGAALPAPDMPGRVEAVFSLAEPSDGVEREALTPLNFRIPASFRREFKTFAATHDLKLNELLRLCFHAYRQQNSDAQKHENTKKHTTKAH